MSYRIDPELLAAIKVLAPLDLSELPQARREAANIVKATGPSPSSEPVLIWDQEIPGMRRSEPAVSVRLYAPSFSSQRPALLYLHGGGYVLGDLNTGQQECMHLAGRLGVTVVSVCYRLAPEDPFPAGLHDAFAALVWLADNASSVSIDSRRIAVCGSSAGAGLAAALALFSRDKDGPSICFQALNSPMLDASMGTESMKQFTDTPIWTRSHSERCWGLYLRTLGPGAAPQGYASPAQAPNLQLLPPAYISTMEYDPLRDEGILFATRLLLAKVPVELHVFPGAVHGAASFVGTAIGRRIRDDQISAIGRALFSRWESHST